MIESLSPDECDLGYGGRLLAPVVGFPPTAPLPVLQIGAFLGAISSGATPHPGLAHWARDVGPSLDEATRTELVAYLAACEEWARRLRRAIRQTASVGDFSSRPSRRVDPNEYEVALRAAFAAAGLRLEAQVPVSQDGEHKRDGFYNTYRLDLCLRDSQRSLLLDVEMDGWTRGANEGRGHDATRNASLRQRGWYIVRVPSTAQQTGVLAAIARQTVAQLETHHAALAASMAGADIVAEALRPIAPMATPILTTPRPVPVAALRPRRRRASLAWSLVVGLCIIIVLTLGWGVVRHTAGTTSSPSAPPVAPLAPARYMVMHAHDLRSAPLGTARTHTTLQRGWMLTANGQATPHWQPVCLIGAHARRCGWAYRPNIVRR